jgi:hypothetical protein
MWRDVGVHPIGHPAKSILGEKRRPAGLEAQPE